MNQIWSWALTLIGVTAMYLAGRKSIWSWVLGLFAQALWLAYSLITRQWGFLLSVPLYGGVYLRNLLRWRAEARRAEEEARG